MNIVVLSGNVVKDAEVHETQTAKTRVSFSLAVSKGFGDDKRTIFVPVVAWNEFGKTVASFAKKGAKLEIKGELSVRAYEKDGKKQTITEVVVDSFESFTKKSSAAAEEEVPQEITEE